MVDRSSSTTACHAIVGAQANGGIMVRRVLLVCGLGVASVCLTLFSRAAGQPQSAAPQFTADGKLVRPEGYRKWGYVSSGYGISYCQSPHGIQAFSNVFVTPPAYSSYLVTGHSP